MGGDRAGHGRLGGPGYQVEALHMPADIDRSALGRLRDVGVEPPIVVLPGPPARWTMLARPHDGPVTAILDLFTEREDIGYAHGGLHTGHRSEWGIDLPPSTFPGQEPLYWLTADGSPLPPSLVVAEVVHAVISR